MTDSPVMNPTELFRSQLAADKSRDEALAELRRTGASPMQCIIALREVEGVGLGMAKRIFSESPSWRDYVDRNDASLIEELERIDES